MLMVFISIVLLISCNRTHKKGLNSDNPTHNFPWIIKPRIVVFTFEGYCPRIIKRNYKMNDDLDLLNRPFPKDTTGLNIKQIKWLNDGETRNFFDSCKIVVERNGDLRGTDCFDPHHVFVYMNDKMEVLSYDLVCFNCSNRVIYGKPLKYNGEYQQLYRFCQFNGLDYALSNPDAFHTYATANEIKCGRLRKSAKEKLVWDGIQRD